MAARKTRKTATRKASTRKTAATRRATKRTKDPRGGLTAAGRAAFRKRDGSNLKPGVKKKKAADMTAQEMRRKGSWAVRFYGRAKLPPLVDKNGRPTRLALSAHAWGEPVPKTVAAARKIAAKGHKLLDRYERLQETDAGRSPARKGAQRKTKRKAPSTRKTSARKSATKTSRKTAVRKSSAKKARAGSPRRTRKAA